MTATKLYVALTAIMLATTPAAAAKTHVLSAYDAQVIADTIKDSCKVSIEMCAMTYDLEKLLRRNGWCYHEDGNYYRCRTSH